MNQIDLKGRVAVITGGARGIGFACAQRFIDSGARVALWDLDGDAITAAVASLGAAARGFVVDVANEGGINAARQS
ncbi:MAG TPA: SDR family NAD(P)-dependent oxidoreductase, partial [Casimicrobium huifangae]|nr:SDR family NAD(P)-dependent oxidoreductase [Casimicrobium huifangae]